MGRNRLYCTAMPRIWSGFPPDTGPPIWARVHALVDEPVIRGDLPDGAVAGVDLRAFGWRRLAPDQDRIEELANEAERIDLLVVPAGRKRQEFGLQGRQPARRSAARTGRPAPSGRGSTEP